MGGIKLSKKAGDGPKWWNHENDSSAARRGAAQWRGGRVIRCARCAGRPRCGAGRNGAGYTIHVGSIDGELRGNATVQKLCRSRQLAR